MKSGQAYENSHPPAGHILIEDAAPMVNPEIVENIPTQQTGLANQLTNRATARNPSGAAVYPIKTSHDSYQVHNRLVVAALVVVCCIRY